MCLELSILYRGTLSSCNYDCPYCPFAKHWESQQELAEDRRGLERFVEWVASRTGDKISVFFTPWGEALVRSWYRDSIILLSHLNCVPKIAVQTNLSCQLDWLELAETSKLGLWCTFHPGQTPLDSFLRQCRRLEELNISYSVGCVGLREHEAEIQRLRALLPDSTYFWINAYKSKPEYYDEDLIQSFKAIDPLFPLNNQRHPSQGKSCRTGQKVITVDSTGDARRCHFVKDVIGNLYQPDFESVLTPRACPNDTCGCHIGYVHLEHLELDRVFGESILERIPVSLVSHDFSMESSRENPNKN